ncbi:unnamed protein product [Adineta ricciae]|uniref:Uncharacterized protein n=1 Tax=Adineta ricciae TaxID=249248 RepID=A0A814JS58_ADIRI|nr:unnamed protein product [Adineta ricciae]
MEKMESVPTISRIVIEPEVTISSDLNDKEKFVQRFKPSILKQNTQSNGQKQTPVQFDVERPLHANDIKEHRLWALGSLILCFFLIGPIIAFYHTRRIRQMKAKNELVRAKSLSERVNSILIISNFIGVFIWVVLLFVIGALFIFGLVY